MFLVTPFRYDIPVEANFLSVWNWILFERSRRILKMHPEFATLTQETIFSHSVRLYVCT
jgi:hypothetical protein